MNPYSEKEILEFENSYNIKIPENLRNSIKELRIELYYLDKDGQDYNIPDEINDHIEYSEYDYLKTYTDCEERANELGYSLNYFMTVDENKNQFGRMYSRLLCVKGPFYGKYGDFYSDSYGYFYIRDPRGEFQKNI
jgi:hypothetical protein